MILLLPVLDATSVVDDKPDVKSSSFTIDPAKDYPGYSVKKL